jgi:hypothetical protein
LVTTAVFEKKEEVAVVETVPEVVVEVVPAVSQIEVSSEKDDIAITEEEVETDDLDAVTVTSEPEYVNVSLKNQMTEVLVETAAAIAAITPVPVQETTPVPVSVSAPEPVVVKEKVKPASWAGLFSGNAAPVATPTPMATQQSKKREPEVKSSSSSSAPAAMSKPSSNAGPSLTVYLSQLPENVVDAEVRVLFEPFGDIKKVDIYVQKGFAFVDFADSSSVKSALLKKGTGYFTIRDSLFQVDERQTKNSSMGGSKPSGGGGNRSGRGMMGGNSGSGRQGNGNGQNKTGSDKNGAKGDNRDNRGGNNNNRSSNNRNTGSKTNTTTKAVAPVAK